MNNERKYRKQINKNGWMVKLHRLCFGKAAPKFIGYCPFFWFTWFCMLFLPVILPVRALILLFSTTGAVWRSIPHKPYRPTDALLLRFYEQYLDTVRNGLGLEWERENNLEAWGRKLFAWIDATPDWKNCAKQVLLRHQRRQARQDVNAAKVKIISKYSGYIVKPVLALVAAIITIVVARVMVSLFAQLTWVEFFFALQVTGFVFAGVFITCLAAVGADMAVKYYRRCPRCPHKVGFWRKLGNGIYATGDFLLDTISAIYTRECPLIEWGDHSEPIQPR